MKGLFRYKNNRFLIESVLLSGIILLLINECKKYPENILIMEPPDVAVSRWKHLTLRSLKVNGTDSMFLIKQTIPDIESYEINITRQDILNYQHGRGDQTIYFQYAPSYQTTHYGIRGHIQLNGKDDYCYFGIGIGGHYEEGYWKILKLNHKEFKIRKIENSNTYEMYFAK